MGNARSRRFVGKVRSWYTRYERPISMISLVGGFVFNIIALKQVDTFSDNFWTALHLLVVATCIILINREENKTTTSTRSNKSPERLHFWLVNILQFFFGGLLSTFIVFYFRSAVLAVAWPFFLILIIAFVVNESFKHHYARIDFQVTFFFFCTYLYLIFLLPIIFHQISDSIFVVAGAASIAILGIFLGVLKARAKNTLAKDRRTLVASILGVIVVINGFYFLNIIPPLPLSLEGAGIYHDIEHTSEGNFTALAEPNGNIDAFLTLASIYPTYHTIPGAPVYAYSAIFSPVLFDTKITHQWEYYDTELKKWVPEFSVDLPVVGGRNEGFRTYSVYSDIKAGKWKINVRTPSGQLIGRMVFNVVVQNQTPALVTKIEN